MPLVQRGAGPKGPEEKSSSVSKDEKQKQKEGKKEEKVESGFVKRLKGL